MRKTMYDGVAFYESRPTTASCIQKIEAKIGGVLTSAQLSTLDDVKRVLASQAKQLGANSVVDFQYGQKSVGILASLFSRDDVNWHGTGTAAIVNE
jgi:uncharacterized protein YbjQ (UPF0145 family)